jgi:hypothetical protein
MVALYHAGRQADALRAYQDFRRVVGEDLGLEPSPELTRLEQQVVAHDPGLHDYWREPGGAYLVMRLMRGGNLRDRIDGGPLPPPRVVEIVAHVAAALTAAGGVGIAHGNLKPTNVLFDEAGNPFVSDFGLAGSWSLLGNVDAPAGARAYTAPELGEGREATARADVFALAVVAYEALTGLLPFGPRGLVNPRDSIPPIQAPRADVPAAVDDLLAASTAFDPTDRPPDVGSFVHELVAAVSPGSTVRLPHVARADVANPYKGLRPFGEADAGDFFGRDALVAELVGRLREGQRFLLVVGGSGSGKSSVVRAGLVPQVRRGAVDGSGEWLVTSMVPGGDPFAGLAVALMSVAAREVDDVEATLVAKPRALTALLDQIPPPPAASCCS